MKFPTTKFEGSNQLRYKETKMDLTITRPDDWHLHLRDGELLEAVVPHRCRSSLIMELRALFSCREGLELQSDVKLSIL